MATFGLVHGAWHGAWCWERLIPHLVQQGHAAVAMDLPCDDPSATFDEYADAVVAALGEADDVVLVGHSLAGVTLPMVARSRPVRLLIYLCGVIPATLSTAGAPNEPPDSAEIFGSLTKDSDGCTFWPKGTESDLYPDLSAEDVEWASSRLRRQCWGMWKSFEPFETIVDLASVTVVARDDQVVLPAWSRWAARERLGGLEPIEIDGGHFPMLARPAELAELLVSLA
jgi:pimeloyl-ACP methyl ester carboxylesterase